MPISVPASLEQEERKIREQEGVVRMEGRK